MNWMEIWVKVFGVTEIYGNNMGFWASMGVVVFVVILMNIVFWSMKPRDFDNNL